MKFKKTKNNKKIEVFEWKYIGSRLKQLRIEHKIKKVAMQKNLNLSSTNTITSMEEGTSESTAFIAVLWWWKNYLVNPNWIFLLDNTQEEKILDKGEAKFKEFEKALKALQEEMKKINNAISELLAIPSTQILTQSEDS